jgi:hypothetical protein
MADRFAKIQPGMTLSEVESIMGGPGADYGTTPINYLHFYTVFTHDIYDERDKLVWVDDAGAVGVWMDEHGVVAEKSYARFLYKKSYYVRRLKRRCPPYLDWLPELF